MPFKLSTFGKLSIGPLVLLAALFCWYFQDLVRTNGYAATIPPEYVRPATGKTQILIIKNVDASGNVLLFQSTNRPKVAVYYPSNGSIEWSNYQSWQASQEREIDCWDQAISDEYSGPSYGYYVLAARKSSDGSKLAVLSAYGPKFEARSSILFGTGERIWGTRYLEFRDIQSDSSVGRPTPIDISSLWTKPRICWSDGGRYVLVYSDHEYSEGTPVSIVTVP